MKLTVDTDDGRRCARRSPPAHGTVTERELAARRARGRRRRSSATARRRRWSPTTASRRRTVRAALEAYAPVLDADRDARADRRRARRAAARSTACPRRSPRSTSRCGTCAGRRTGEPVWRCSARRSRRPVAGQRDDRRRRPRRAPPTRPPPPRATGFGRVKVKVGDRRRRRAARRGARAAGPDMAIRLDANGAWVVEEAVRRARALAPVGLELSRSPSTASRRSAALRDRVTACARDRRDRRRPRRARRRRADAVCLKISRCGGISGAARRGARAPAPPAYEVYLASTLDGPLGIAAALHAAAVAPGPTAPAGWPRSACSTSAADPLPARTRARSSPPGGPGARRRASATGTSARRRPTSATRAGRLQVHGVAGAGHHVQRGRRAAPPPSRSAIAWNFASRSPDDQVDRHRQLAQALPQRRHRARPEAAQRRGQPGGRVAQPVGVHGGLRPPAAGRRTPRLRAQRCANASIVIASTSAASRSSAARRSRALGRVRDARGWPRSAPAAAPARAAPSATCSASRPPIE